MSISPDLARPGEENAYQNDFVTRVVESFVRVTGRDLVKELSLHPGAVGREVFFGNYALLCHRGEVRPMLTYGNQFALRLWEASWEELVRTPSSATAPEEDIGPRQALLQKVERDNFVAGYSGRRISFKGRRFLIQDVTVWRLLDETGVSFGTGAFFSRYRYL
jgi:hypothetical protein